MTSMANMFYGATAFNNGGADGIKAWKTGLVEDMSNMFTGAAAFNQPIPKNGDKWDTAKVTHMTDMFNAASAFNTDISNWAVGSVTNNVDMFTNSGLAQSRQPCTNPATVSSALNWRACPPMCPPIC